MSVNSRNPRKDKRGVHGSQDEETNEAKLLSTASSPVNTTNAVANMDSDQEEREPTLGELRNMLVDLQNSVANILKDNALVRTEIAEVKSSSSDANFDEL